MDKNDLERHSQGPDQRQTKISETIRRRPETKRLVVAYALLITRILINIAQFMGGYSQAE